MSVMLQGYSVKLDHGMSEPGYGKEVVYDLNSIYKCYIYIYILLSNIQL